MDRITRENSKYEGIITCTKERQYTKKAIYRTYRKEFS